MAAAFYTVKELSTTVNTSSGIMIKHRFNISHKALMLNFIIIILLPFTKGSIKTYDISTYSKTTPSIKALNLIHLESCDNSHRQYKTPLAIHGQIIEMNSYPEIPVIQFS